MKKYRIILFFLITLILFGCTTTKDSNLHKEQNYVTIVAVGDNLIHEALITSALVSKDDNDNKDDKNEEYNFLQYYNELKSTIKNADLAFINQETLIAGKEFGYSGYPLFNGPKEIGEALVNLGFDVVNHATNHTMDKGEGAVLAVIDFWKAKPNILVLGIHESQETRNTKKNIKNIKNIKIGFLSYTYGLNGIPLPKDRPYLVSLINTEIMAKEIDELRPLCDFLVVSMHWGNEYEHSPNKRQIELAEFLANHNVDLVIGHHPHVLQPVARLTKKDGGSMLCYYSLGNFISAQSENPRMLGGMMRIKIKKSKTVVIEDAELIPIVTHYEKGQKKFGVYFLNNYNDDLAVLHALNKNKNEITKNYFLELFTKIFGDIIIP
jgi:poly-gamma-glutamate synthesis protein (capsule biosynthesis protein)